MAGTWTEAENDSIVADYFAMLAHDVRGLPYSKTEHRRGLMVRIERSEGSIEYKHQNISAVLKALGEDWIPGYKPAFNFQMSLVDAVVRWLGRNPEWHDPRHREGPVASQVSEQSLLFVSPPPTLRNEPDPQELQQTLEIARKFDVAARDEANRALGKAGEECALAYEKSTLLNAGRSDLARKVVWVSREIGDGAGYDIESFSLDGEPRLIEVKTTNGWERTPFHISQNELRVADENRRTWLLFRVHSFSRSPRAFELRPPLCRHVELAPTSFRASFKQA